jgi:hypothetical protein
MRERMGGGSDANLFRESRRRNSATTTTSETREAEQRERAWSRHTDRGAERARVAR